MGLTGTAGDAATLLQHHPAREEGTSAGMDIPSRHVVDLEGCVGDSQVSVTCGPGGVVDVLETIGPQVHSTVPARDNLGVMQGEGGNITPHNSTHGAETLFPHHHDVADV